MEINRQSRAPHGSKRPAGDDQESEQRLTKRFRSLSLRRNDLCQHGSLSSHPPTSLETDEAMHLDDSPHKVYIHDLDQELDSVEPAEESITFLPEIEKRLNAIPNAILTRPTNVNQNREVVLYRVPSSITVPKEQDSVRRAIIESRARAKAKKAEEEAAAISKETVDWKLRSPLQLDGPIDPDEMDIG